MFKQLWPNWLPMRVIICVMTFTCTWTNYMCRLQMPILVVPMIKASTTEKVSGACTQNDETRQARSLAWMDPGHLAEMYILNSRFSEKKIDSLVDYVDGARKRRQADEKTETRSSTISLFSGLPFDWEPKIRGQLIAAYSYGNVPGNFFGGIMAMKWGPRRTILWTSILAATTSLISPLLAQFHWTILMLSRIIIGFTGGITFPACHTLVAKWAPPNEKARFVWSLLGGTFGTIMTYPMIAAIADHINWESGWYIPSLLMFIWIAVWALLAYDSPEEHPAISQDEKEYILTSQAGTVRKEKPTMKQTPLKAIFTSIPFLSLITCHFGNMFLLFFYQNSMMLYLTKALGFNLTKGGSVAALPWAGRMLFGFFFSWAGDTIKRKQIISITALRKIATIFSHFIPGIFLVLVGYVGCSYVLANIFLFLALGFNGAASIANLSNNQDLSPNFAGFLYGIMNTIGCTAGMIIPPIVEEVAGKYGNPIDKWQILFWIGAIVCILCMAIFIVGGSGEIQSWNEIQLDPTAADPEGRAGTAAARK